MGVGSMYVQGVHEVSRAVPVPLSATMVAQLAFMAAKTAPSSNLKFGSVVGFAVAIVLAVTYRRGARDGLLTACLTILAADFFFLGPPFQFGVESRCHAMVLASIACASIVGVPAIEVYKARARQISQPIGLSLSDSTVLVCEPSEQEGQLKAVHIVRDI